MIPTVKRTRNPLSLALYCFLRCHRVPQATFAATLKQERSASIAAGPFRDPKTGYIHLFMQYCPRGPCFGQHAPGNHTPNYQSATHFYSKDGGATWIWTGNASGVVASCDPLARGQCPPEESSTDCPDSLGVYSGSTTIVDGVPSYAYPGVHLYDYNGDSSAVTMTQCIATPADPADPALTHWKKRTIISHTQIPHGISQHFHVSLPSQADHRLPRHAILQLTHGLWHSVCRITQQDDSTAFEMNGRWWIFMGSAACGGNATGDCPFPDPTIDRARDHGVNYLFSTDNFTHGEWRAEHSLYNTSSFVSCPVRMPQHVAFAPNLRAFFDCSECECSTQQEFYTLPLMKEDQYIYHAMGSPNVFGTFDTENMVSLLVRIHIDSTRSWRSLRMPGCSHDLMAMLTAFHSGRRYTRWQIRQRGWPCVKVILGRAYQSPHHVVVDRWCAN